MQIGINENGKKLPAAEVLTRVAKALETVEDLFGANIGLLWPSNKSSYRIQTTLDFDHATEIFRRRSDTGRRINGVCYHGHLAFMVELYADNPTTILRTAMASWDNVVQFSREFEYVGNRNVGAEANYLAYENACVCDDKLIQKVIDRYYEVIG